ncbi:MAG: hypothetical protein AAGC79_00340 [Pseudomonadota bacterium]
MISIIGWGSLIWDLEILEPHTIGHWRMEAGPELPLEFARISPKRKQALALCLEANHGTICKTNVIMSARSDIEAAIADLAARERAPMEKIGAFCRTSRICRGSDLRVVRQIETWCVTAGWKGAVWTDLEPNFQARLGEPFSVARALTYLRSLSGASLDEAVRYIELAPATTNTALRQVLSHEPWWQVEARRLGLK